jgi:hypothetical protein
LFLLLFTKNDAFCGSFYLYECMFALLGRIEGLLVSSFLPSWHLYPSFQGSTSTTEAGCGVWVLLPTEDQKSLVGDVK